jgi:hypothetical protein
MPLAYGYSKKSMAANYNHLTKDKGMSRRQAVAVMLKTAHEAAKKSGKHALARKLKRRRKKKMAA